MVKSVYHRTYFDFIGGRCLGLLGPAPIGFFLGLFAPAPLSLKKPTLQIESGALWVRPLIVIPLISSVSLIPTT